MSTHRALQSRRDSKAERRSEDFFWEPTVPVGFLWDLIQASRERGLAVDALLVAQGLESDGLATVERRVSVNVYSAVLAAITRSQNDAFAGFLSSPVPLRAFPLLCYGFVGCRTLDEVVAYTNAFYGMFCDDLRWKLARSGEETEVEISVNNPLTVENRFAVHSVMVMSLRLFGWLYGEDIRPLWVEQPFEAKPWDANLEYLFGAPIEHECPRAAFSISRDYEDAELSCTRDQITQMLHCTRNLFFMSRWAPPITQQVRKLILTHRSDGWLSIEEVASRLGVSPNRLWQLLKREGTSFLAIRDQLKRDWAITLIENGDRSVEQIADLLGYGDASAFRKAFKKWTGMQPGAARKTAVAASRAYADRRDRRRG